jgi:type VI protein secretion system component VasF
MLPEADIQKRIAAIEAEERRLRRRITWLRLTAAGLVAFIIGFVWCMIRFM